MITLLSSTIYPTLDTALCLLRYDTTPYSITGRAPRKTQLSTEVQGISFVGYTGGEGSKLRLWNLQNLCPVPPYAFNPEYFGLHIMASRRSPPARLLSLKGVCVEFFYFSYQ